MFMTHPLQQVMTVWLSSFCEVPFYKYVNANEMFHMNSLYFLKFSRNILLFFIQFTFIDQSSYWGKGAFVRLDQKNSINLYARKIIGITCFTSGFKQATELINITTHKIQSFSRTCSTFFKRVQTKNLMLCYILKTTTNKAIQITMVS